MEGAGPAPEPQPPTAEQEEVHEALIEPDFASEQDEIRQKYLLYLYEMKEAKEAKKKSKGKKAPPPAPPPPSDPGVTAALAPNTTASAEPKKEGEDEFVKLNYNTTVWVTGLPLDATKEEILECFSKVGVVKKHPNTGDLLIKMYKDANDKFDGSAIVTFIKRESIDLAIKVLNNAELRLGTGKLMHIEEARIKKREGMIDKGPSRKKKKKHDPTMWTLEDDAKVAGVGPKTKPGTLILKHMFVLEDFTDPDFMNTLKEDVQGEAAKVGEVTKVQVYDTNPEGVIAVRYRDRQDAEKAVTVFNGRYFAKRKIEAELWDGTTNYKIEESDEVRRIREEHWNRFLGDEDS